MAKQKEKIAENILDTALLGLSVIKSKDPNFEYSNSGVTMVHVCQAMNIDESLAGMIQCKLMADGLIEYINKDYKRLVRLTQIGDFFIRYGGYFEGNQNRDKRQPSTFKDLFVNSEYFRVFLDAMTKKDIITSKGGFNPLNGRNTEIIALIEALKRKGYIRKDFQSTTVRIFCEELKVKVGKRTMGTVSYIVRQSIPDYERFLPDVIK